MMLRLKSPKVTSQFIGSQKIKDARKAAQDAIRNAKKPKFTSHWSDFKADYSAAQHGRCAFCESKVIGNQFGDVEHFRPKGEIWRLKDDPGTWGRERPNLSTIEGREHETVRDTGYWWLAYEWDNYLLSCSTCNSVYKASFFPVVDDEYKTGPRSRKRDRPLLLNPFRGPRPETHLTYNPIGMMEPRNNSKYGKTTIVYLGLNRTGLIEEREPIATRVIRNCRDLATGSPDLQRRAAQDLYDMGKAGRPFAGMVRIMVKENAKTDWNELEDLLET